MAGYIYKITNLITNKSYIGFTNRPPYKRKAEHWSPCQHKRKTKLYNSINKHGIENFVFDVIYCSLDESHCLSTMEPYFIGLYDCVNNGYNLTFGGDRSLMTEEVKNRISRTKMGHHVSEETKEKLRQYNNRNWLIRLPDNTTIQHNNLKEFCKVHKLNYKCFLNTKNCNRTKTGFKLVGGY